MAQDAVLVVRNRERVESTAGGGGGEICAAKRVPKPAPSGSPGGTVQVSPLPIGNGRVVRAVAHGSCERGNIPVRARPNPDSTGWLGVTSHGNGGLSRHPPTPLRSPSTEWLSAGGGWGAGRLSS